MSDGTSLLGQVQSDLLNGKPLPDLLRKCLLLGSQSGSAQLRTWASKELRGHQDEDELPAYRKVGAQIFADATAGRTWATGLAVSWSALPQFARDHLPHKVSMADGVGQLQSLLDSAVATDSNPRLSLPSWASIAREFDRASGNPLQRTHALYWVISSSSIAGVLDNIRTALTELLAELGAVMPSTQDIPTAEQATQALHIAVNGGQPHFHVATAITAPRALGGSTISNTTGGQVAAATGDVDQRGLNTPADDSAAARGWLDEYSAAIHELDVARHDVGDAGVEA